MERFNNGKDKLTNVEMQNRKGKHCESREFYSIHSLWLVNYNTVDIAEREEKGEKNEKERRSVKRKTDRENQGA